MQSLMLLGTGSANFMRLTMNFKLAALETLYHEIETGVELTSEEQLLRFKNLDIGLNEDTLDTYYSQRAEQQEAAIHYKHAEDAMQASDGYVKRHP